MVAVLWQLWFCLVNLPELLHIDHLYQVCSLLSYVFMCFGLGRVGGKHWDGTRGDFGCKRICNPYVCHFS